jgi:DNA polymerase I
VTDTLLIDGDEFLFKACSAVEREIHWDEQNHVLYANRHEAWDNFTRLVERAGRDVPGDDCVLCFSGERPYFRELLAETYKGGRRTRKPLCYAALRELCAANYTVRSFDTLEADDVMGILSTKPVKNDTRYIIVSQDKDMQTVPGWLYRQGNLHFITEQSADEFWLLQTLMGDPTDGYSGCPGLGEKRAAAWLSADTGPGLPFSWERVVGAFEKARLAEADALLQARLARILRWEDWDSKNKEPILWSP